MKYSTLIATVFLSGLTAANPFKITIEPSDFKTEEGSCDNGRVYCATYLVDQRGYSIAQLQDYSKKQGGPTDEQAIKNSSFTCRGGYYVVFEEQCEYGCLVTSSDKNDRCKYSFESNAGLSDNNNILQVEIGL